MDIIHKSIEYSIDPDSITDQSAEKPFGGFKAVASDESRDRDGENLYREEWLTLPDHITIDTDHGMSVATTVGSAHPYFEGNEMIIDASFSSIERAQEARTLILEGHIKTVSVAQLVDRSKKSGSPNKRELLNVGIVAIPANKNAIIFDAKGFKGNRAESMDLDEAAVNFLLAVKAGAGTSAGSSDGAMVQAIHDAAGHLGASCIVVEVPVEDTAMDSSGAEDGANKSVDGEITEVKTGVAVLDDAPEVEDEEVEEVDPVVGDEPTPEVVATAETLSTDEILNAILGEKSIDVGGTTVSAEQFKDALNHIITNASNGEPQGESPADAPVTKAAAAAELAPAPADVAAVEAAESDVVPVEKRLRQMRMALDAADFALVD